MLLKFVCGNNSFQKHVKKAGTFRTVTSMLKKYRPAEINPKLKTKEELTRLYRSFPGYREKIKKYGIVAFELS